MGLIYHVFGVASLEFFEWLERERERAHVVYCRFEWLQRK